MSDERWQEILLLLALGVLMIYGLISFVSKLDVNGEVLYEDTKISQPVEPSPSIEVPVSCTATPIIEEPVYVKSISFECVEDTEDETLYPTRDEVYCLSRIVHGEASVCSVEVKATVAWVVLNRVDAPNYPNTIREVCSQSGQFAGWNRDSSSAPTAEEREMCYEIIKAWKNFDDRYRTIPSDYLYFMGDGNTNYFTMAYYGDLATTKKNAYDFHMPNFWRE